MPLSFLLSVVWIQLILPNPRNTFLFLDDLLNEILFGLLLLYFEIQLFVYFFGILFILWIDLILPWSWDILYSFFQLIDERFLLLALNSK